MSEDLPNLSYKGAEVYGVKKINVNNASNRLEWSKIRKKNNRAKPQNWT